VTSSTSIPRRSRRRLSRATPHSARRRAMQGLCELAMAQRKGSHRIPPLIRSSVARGVHHLANFEPSSPHACCAQEREERRERCPPTHRPHQNTPADVLNHHIWASGADRGPHCRCAHTQPPHSGQRERPRVVLEANCMLCRLQIDSICADRSIMIVVGYITSHFLVQTGRDHYTVLRKLSYDLFYLSQCSRRGRAGARLRRDEGIFRGWAE